MVREARWRYIVVKPTKGDSEYVDRLRDVIRDLFGLCSPAWSFKVMRVRGIRCNIAILRTTNRGVPQLVTACALTPLSDNAALRVLGIAGTVAKAKEISKRHDAW